MTIPSWVHGLGPSELTQALHAGAQVGLALSERQERAHEAALNRSSHEAQALRNEAFRQKEAEDKAAEFQQTAAERAMEFQQKQQESQYQLAKESRLQQYELARIGLQKAKDDIAAQRAVTNDKHSELSLKMRENELSARLDFNDLQRKKFEASQQDKPMRETVHSPLDGSTLSGTPDQLNAYRAQLKAKADAAASPAPLAGPSLMDNIGRGIGNMGKGLWNSLYPVSGDSGDMGPATQPNVAPESAPAASSGVRVRRKSDGATFNYRGNAADVPTDAYDVLQ